MTIDAEKHPELVGIPLTPEDEVQISMADDGEAENNTVDLSVDTFELIVLRMRELMEIVRQNALLAEDEL